MEHGKIEENTVNSGISTVGEIRELEALSNMMFSTGFMATKVVKYRALKETIAKTWKHIQRTRDLGTI